jgi:phosphoglycerol geranylgeranyltransferase
VPSVFYPIPNHKIRIFTPMPTKILHHLQNLRATGRKALALLADPDKAADEEVKLLSAIAEQKGVDFLLAGGSLLSEGSISELVNAIKRHSSIPVVIFPGSAMQVTPEADAIFLLSLISGRNPDLLIGQHVIAAPALKKSGLEIIPTGYMLIDGGKITTAHYVSNTLPIPADKPDIAACTALAGEMLGLKVIYMDAGSGALNPITPEMVEAVSQATSLPLIVGGGIRNRDQAGEILAAGADMIVIGTAMEKPGAASLLHEISTVVASF